MDAFRAGMAVILDDPHLRPGVARHDRPVTRPPRYPTTHGRVLWRRDVPGQGLVLPNLKNPSRAVTTVHLAAAHASLPGELLLRACEHDLRDDDLFRHARVRQIVRPTKSLALAQGQAGWARLHTEYLTLGDDVATRLMLNVLE
jgi:hypothetical protein